MSSRLLFCWIFSLATMFNLNIAEAAAMFSLGGAYSQDSNTLADQSAFSNYAVNAAAYASLAKGNQVLYLGIEGMSTEIRQSLDASTKATLTSTDYMLALKYAFAQKELFALTVGFSPYTQATYKVTSLNSDTWYGTSYMTKFSVQPELGLDKSKLKIAASILYYHSAYTKKTNSSSSNSSGSKQSFERSFTAPAIDLIFKF